MCDKAGRLQPAVINIDLLRVWTRALTVGDKAGRCQYWPLRNSCTPLYVHQLAGVLVTSVLPCESVMCSAVGRS
jgi:hypothetical protein